jgi:hypothetical protein
VRQTKNRPTNHVSIGFIPKVTTQCSSLPAINKVF